MDVRCEKCHKLFRVPDEKISASGIKFVCTRCGEYVIVSPDELKQHQSSKPASVVVDRSQADSDAVLQQTQKEKPGQETPSSSGGKIAVTVPVNAPKAAHAVNIEPMEVRCSNCKKLFRIPGSKISGEGIRFVCTRCGEYVKVTRDEFDLYLHAKHDVHPPDTTLLTPQRAEQTVHRSEEEPADDKSILAAMLQREAASSNETPQTTPENSPAAFPDPGLPRETQPVLETAPAAEARHAHSDPLQVSQLDLGIEFTFDPQPEPAEMPKPEPKVEQHLEPAQEFRPEPVQAPKSELRIDPEQAQTVVQHIEPAPGPYPEPVQAPEPELKSDFTFDSQPEPEQTPKAEQYAEPAPGSRSEPVQVTKIESKSDPAQKPKLEPAPVQISPSPVQSKAELKIVTEQKPEPVRTAAPVTRPAEPKKQISTPEKAPSRPVPSPAKKVVQEIDRFRSARTALFVLAAVVLITLAGYGIVTLLKPPWRIEREAHEQSLVEGMQLTSVTGSMDANGDILINGVIQNTDGKEKNAWFVVVEVYNKQGTLLNKIRLVNGKQIYTKRDYDVLAKRGVNVQALKEKSLDEQGVIIPPKGTVSFEARYIQPPDEFASFKALLQPFDPVRRFREISDETR